MALITLWLVLLPRTPPVTISVIRNLQQQNELDNLILTNHWFQSTESTPDQHWATQCLMATDNKSQEIWNLTGQIWTLLESIQGDVEWTTDRYVDGIPIYQYTGEQLVKVNDAISDLDLHCQIHTIWDPIAEPMKGNKKTHQPRIQTLSPPTPTIPWWDPPQRPTTRSMTNAARHYNWHTCCIHCRGKHTSEDHHLSLAIPPLPTLATATVTHQRRRRDNLLRTC